MNLTCKARVVMILGQDGTFPCFQVPAWFYVDGEDLATIG